MVLVNRTVDMLLDDRAAVLRCVVADASTSPSDKAFLAWVLRDSAPPPDLEALATAAATRLAGTKARSHHEVAVLGFAAARGLLQDAHGESLLAGLEWLCGRSPKIAGEVAPFVVDPVSLLGVAFGGTKAGEPYFSSVADWFRSFAPKAATLPAIEPWQRALFSAALRVVGVDEVPMPKDPSVADVRTALRAHSLHAGDDGKQASEDDELRTLQTLKTEHGESIPALRAALQLAALAWIRRDAPTMVPGRAAVEDVAEVLRRVPAGLRRWAWDDRPRTRSGTARKWYVDHEYHVQDALYFLLAPLFPDLKDEENLPSVGQKKPRTDLFLPSLKLVIEVKFVRPGDTFQKVIDEVASDASLYLANDSEYTGIVVFVWDDSRRTEEHAKLVEGLRAMNGILDAVVVPRPGRMAT